VCRLSASDSLWLLVIFRGSGSATRGPFLEVRLRLGVRCRTGGVAR